VGVEPEQGELADGDAAGFAQREALHFLQSLDEPGARAVRAVVVLVELRGERVLAFEHPDECVTRMRNCGGPDRPFRRRAP